ALQGHYALQQGFDGILEVVALINHVSRLEGFQAFVGRVDELVENEEEPVRPDRTRRQVVVAVHVVVEVETTELTCRQKPRDDELYIGIREVMTEIDQAERLVAERLCQHVRRPPVLYDRRVESRLEWLVLGEQPPVSRQLPINLL